jgi:hypothetical protein
MYQNSIGFQESLDENDVRSPHEIIFRAMCVSAIITRGELEKAALGSSNEGREVLNSKVRMINAGLDESEAYNFLTPIERALLAQPYGAWDLSSDYDSIRLNNQLGVLLWALSLIDELPKLYENFPEHLYWYVGIPVTTSDLFEAVQLRTVDELIDELDTLENSAFEEDHEELINLLIGEDLISDVDRLERVLTNQAPRRSALDWVLDSALEWED